MTTVSFSAIDHVGSIHVKKDRSFLSGVYTARRLGKAKLWVVWSKANCMSYSVSQNDMSSSGSQNNMSFSTIAYDSNTALNRLVVQ